jgi:class 3 adenylate cyclase
MSDGIGKELMHVDVEDIEAILGLGRGAFDHIPKYCRKEAIEAIAHVRRMEENRLLRSGVYYVVLSDLSGATDASAKLGVDLNRRRVESFITVCVESLGASKPNSYAQFLKPVGDAALFLFSAFFDLYGWWREAQSRMQLYSSEWNRELESDKRSVFQLRSKTVIHVGEVVYSEEKDPVAAAVNQVFKIEKLFKPGELGSTETARMVASPFFPDLSLQPVIREEVTLPGADAPMMTWVLATNEMANYDLA